ncbi:zinc finger HIT domain-containing protein 1 [Microdochium nivale]|nr:zinc finger HIT domain-containing protein 1 [Microdochium nivale]
MNNFGVVELASARTTNAPGWAYVPDLGPTASGTAGAAPNRKRGARAAATASVKFSYADVDARHDAKLRKELEGLDRDNQPRDAAIPVPPSRRLNPRTRQQGGGGSVGGGGGGGVGAGSNSSKNMANVRRILQSQKTFANHLDDYVALLALNDGHHPPPPQQQQSQGGASPAVGAARAPAGHGRTNSTSHATSASNSSPAPASRGPRAVPATVATTPTSSARKKSVSNSSSGLGSIPVINSKMSYARREQLLKRIEQHKMLMAQQQEDADEDAPEAATLAKPRATARGGRASAKRENQADVEMADAPPPSPAPEKKGRGKKTSAAADAAPSTPTAGASTTPASKRQKATADNTPCADATTAMADTPTKTAQTTDESAATATTDHSATTTTTTIIKNEPDAAPNGSTTETTTPVAPPDSTGRAPPAHSELDAHPLLASRVPPLPSDDELRALLAAPPLSYLEIRATYPAADGSGARYPARVFCELCGYWGRVKCMKCGTRVCALDCLDTHKEECVTRYGL